MDVFYILVVAVSLWVGFIISIQFGRSKGYKDGMLESQAQLASQAYRSGYRDCMKSLNQNGET